MSTDVNAVKMRVLNDSSTALLTHYKYIFFNLQIMYKARDKSYLKVYI